MATWSIVSTQWWDRKLQQRECWEGPSCSLHGVWDRGRNRGKEGGREGEREHENTEEWSGDNIYP